MAEFQQDISMCGIPWRMTVAEGLVTFRHIHGIYGHHARINITKSAPHELLYISFDETFGRMPACHIAAAANKAVEFLGPDHFPSVAAKDEFDRRCAKRSDQTQPPDLIVTVRGPGRTFDAEWQAVVNSLRAIGATVEEVNEEPCEPRRVGSGHRIRVIAEHLPWGG